MTDEAISEDGIGTRPSPRRREPDAHGQAALVLVEAVLHFLVETGKLTVGQAIGVVRAAAEVKKDLAKETDESEGRMQQSLALLGRVERSLAADHQGGAIDDNGKA